MNDPNATRIGRVRHVLGATVTVALDPELAGISPIYRGRLLAVGQVGSLVRIPQGLIDLVGSVSLVGIAELSGSLAPSDLPQRDERWLKVELLGEVNRGTGRFQRGVGSYPSIDDSVHFTTSEDLAAVFPPPGDTHVRIGALAAADEIPVSLDARRLVVRHSAIVGSTGAGKTNTVATLLQAFASGGWPSANVIVIDPHGEYASALGAHGSVRSVFGTSRSELSVPYWALPASDIARIFARGVGGASFTSRFTELVAEKRREFASAASWLKLDPAAVTADTPIPFNVREVWHQMDWENRETRTQKPDPATACETEPGDASKLESARFTPYGAAGQPPHKGPLFDVYGTMPDLLRLGLKDRRLEFFQRPKVDPGKPDPLPETIREWLGGKDPISILDFSGVPMEAADAAIGVILNLLFELAVRGEAIRDAPGRSSPVLIVLEEAHRYLGETASALSRESANRIAREGRKYGIGLMLVTQRPTELPRTALAQVGTLIALRLSNAEDQGAIRAALPDSVAGLAAVLPSLRTGEAIVSGESVVVPLRTLVDLPEPEPSAEDPSLHLWTKVGKKPDPAGAVTSWRNAYVTRRQDD